MSHVLMICHDQHLDRRILAQALSLISENHTVTLLMLSLKAEREETVTLEGIRIIHIGLNEIIPTNSIYVLHNTLQKSINHLLNACCNHYPKAESLWYFMFKLGRKMNQLIYHLLLFLRYRNRKITDPLPFTSVFVQTGLCHKADIVQVHDLPGLEAGVTLAQTWQVPLIYDAHELYPEQRSFSSAQRKICYATESKLIKKVDLVFAVNESIAQEMENRYQIKKPTPLLNAIDPPTNFNPEYKYDLLRQKLPIIRTHRILLFQGGFAPYRNLPFLIQAMSLLKTDDIHLVMMGFGDFGETLQRKAQQLGLLHKRIHFLPAVPQSELLQHSASADIGIIPYPPVDLNSYYCTPNKLFEYIQAGLPILANKSPELEHFVTRNEFGMTMNMRNPPEIAVAIDQIFSSNDQIYWKNNLLEKREQFSWRVQEAVYLSKFHELLNKPS